MATAARLESKLGLNDTEFTEGIVRAEKRAQTFAGRAERSFSQLFKRSPHMRAERAVDALVGNLASGDVAGGIAHLAGRISGLGLGVGVAIGAGVEIFSKLKTSVDEVREAHEKLDAQMRRPLNIISNLSSGELKQAIQSLGADIDDFQKKVESGPHNTTNLFKDVFFGGLGAAGTSDIKDQIDLNAARERKATMERTAGRNELRRQNVIAGIGNDPKRVALAEARLKIEEEIASIQAGPQDKGARDKIAALNVQYDQLNKNYDLSKKAAEQEFEDAKKLLGIKKLGATPEEEKKLEVGLKLQSVNRQLERTDLSPEEKRSLTLQKMGLENDALQFKPKDTAPKNPFAYGTLAARNWEDENGRWGSLATANKETNDPTAYGSLAWNAVQRGEAPMPAGKETENQLVVTELRKLTGLFEEAWKK